MPVLTILYPNTEDGFFDFDYYLEKHIPLSEEINGAKFEILKGVSSVDGQKPPFICIARLPIRSVEQFIETITTRGQVLIDDMPNYTNIQPILQFDEVVRSPEA
jgi:uncharacterized protein (TIGR02118 family)